MPVVPIYSTPQVAPQGLPDVAVRAPEVRDYAGAQLREAGEAMQRAGGVLADVAFAEQREANDLRVQDGLNQAISIRTGLRTQASQLRGRAALERPDGMSLADEFGKKYDDSVQQIASGLGNDAQRRAFTQRAAQAGLELRDGLSRYMVEQQRAFAVETNQSTITTAVQQGVTLYNDPAARAESLAGIDLALGNLARMEGWDEKTLAAKRIEAVSPLHAGIVRALVTENNPTAAREYYQANSAAMTLQDRANLQSTLKASDLRVRAQTFADQVQADGLTLEQALAKARKDLSGDEEEAAVNEVKTRYTEAQAIEARAQREISSAAWKAVVANPRRSAIPDDLWSKLQGDEQRQITDWLEATARRARADAESGGDSPSDLQTWYGLRQMAAENPDQFARLDLMKSAPYLSKANLRDLIGIQTGLIRGDGREAETQRVVANTLRQIQVEVRAAGIDLTPDPKKDKKKAEEATAFMSTLTRALDDANKARREANKPPLTSAEAREIGLSMVREGIEQGSGVFGYFQTRRRGFEIASDPTLAGRTFIAQPFARIPPEARDKLIAELPNVRRDRGGRAVLTLDQEAQIERAYTRGLNQGRF